jgi:hypothetical protein
MKYDLKTPCGKCPFRKDRPFHLGSGRVREIQAGLVRGEFPCHKTTIDVDGEDGSGGRTSVPGSKHCAGALILLEKLAQPSQMMRIAERLGMYDRRALKMDAPVYDSWAEMRKGCA